MSSIRRPRDFLSGLNAFQDSLQCSICLDTLKNPVRTKCGHRFCQFCLQKVINEGGTSVAGSSSVRCPMCNAPRLTKRSLAKDEEGILLIGALDEIKRAFAEDCGGILRFGDHPYKFEEMFERASSPAAAAAESSSSSNFLDEARDTVRRGTRLSRRKRKQSPPRVEEKGPSKDKPVKRTPDESTDGRKEETTKKSGRPEKPSVQPMEEETVTASSTNSEDKTNMDPFVRVHRLRVDSDKDVVLARNDTCQETKLTETTTTKKKNKIVFQLKGKTWVDPDRLAVGTTRRRIARFVQLGRLAKKKDHFQSYPAISDILAKQRRSFNGSVSGSTSRGGADANVSAWLEGGGIAKNQDRIESGDHPTTPATIKVTKSSAVSGQKEKTSRETLGDANVSPSAAAAAAAAAATANIFYSPSDDVYFNPEPSTSKPFDPFYFEEEPETPKTYDTRRSRSRRVSKDKIINTVLKESKSVYLQQQQTKNRPKSTTPKLNMKQVCKVLTPKDIADVENVDICNSDSLDVNDEEPEPARKRGLNIVRTGSEFTRKIVGENKDLYSSDEETSSQRERRMSRQKEEEGIVREVVLQEGRLQSKRRRIRAPTSSSSSEQSGSPRKDISTTQQSSQRSQVSITKYLKAGNLSGSPRAKSKETEKFDSVSSQRFSSQKEPLKSTLRSIENIPRCVISIDDIMKSKNDNIQQESEHQEEYEEMELPDIETCLDPHDKTLLQSPSCISSNASAEDSEHDGSTQDINYKLLQLREAMKKDNDSMELPAAKGKRKRRKTPAADDDNFLSKSLLGSSQASTTRTSRSATVDSDGGSDNDMFGSTPGSKPKERKRIRRLSQSSSSSSARKPLDYGEGPREQIRGEVPEAAAASATAAASLADTFCEALVSQELLQEQKSYVLLSTGLNLASRDDFAAFLKKFGCETRANLDSSVTHVVVGCSQGLHAERTLKYLQAVAMGKNIVSVEWITDCLRRNALLPVDQYEPVDETGVEGPKKSRLAKAEKRPGLFSGFEFFLKDNFKLILKDQMKQLLQLCGGTVLRTASLFSYNKGTTALVIVDKDSGSKTEEESLRTFLQYDVAVIDKDWVIECIATYSIKPLWESLQHECSEEDLVKAGYKDRALFESS